ncbi:protease [Pedobacter sp. AW1-32]|uniref:protease n=1 Tax=Pedobacter sp. AW1-32 TaxID=3383026 RepID=UPI003FEEF56A
MKNILNIAASAMLLAACTPNPKESAGSKTDSVHVSSTTADTIAKNALTVKIDIEPKISLGDSIMMKFTVNNPSETDKKFCKWHTPFEPPLSKYLDIVNDKGEEVQYLGAMAKRISPPPASSYINIKAGEDLSATINLGHIYKLDKAGKYTVKYNSEAVSGLLPLDSTVFEIK